MDIELLNKYHSENIFVYDVINILEEYFGEDRVDAVLPTTFDGVTKTQITIHFPEVRVTNEYDNFVDIQDLYVRFKVSDDGRLARSNDYNTIKMIRTTFNSIQFLSGYSHSHLIRDSIGNWSVPCFGHGPINTTITELLRSFDDMYWGLFCHELNIWTQVESIAGIPYFRMESIGTNSNSTEAEMNRSYWFGGKWNLDDTGFNYKNVIKELLKSPELRFSFMDYYDLGISDNKFVILASNAALELLKQNSETQTDYNRYRSQYFSTYVVKDGKFYKYSNTKLDLINNNFPFLYFKENPIYLKIIDDDGLSLNNLVTLLRPSYIKILHTELITIINSLYGKPIVNGKTAII